MEDVISGGCQECDFFYCFLNRNSENTILHFVITREHLA